MSFSIPNTPPEEREAILLRIERLIEARRVTGSWTADELDAYRRRLERTYLDEENQ